MKKVIFGLMAAAVIGLTSCAKYPQVQIDAAKAAIEVARQAEAEKYASADFVALQDTLNVSIEKAEKEKAKFLFKSYDESVVGLTAVVTLSETVKASAIAKKAEIKAEVEGLLVSVKAQIEENKALVAKAPKGKEGKAAIEAITGEIAMSEADVAEVERLATADDLLGAQSKIKAVAAKTASINAELNEVIAKSKGGKKK